MEACSDREVIAAFLDRSIEAQIYALADLEEPLWSQVQFFVARRDREVVATALRFEGLSVPLLHAIAPPGDADTRSLLQALADALPRPLFATLPVGCSSAIPGVFESEGLHAKMIWRPRRFEGGRVEGLCRLGRDDFAELEAFYRDRAYRREDPGTAFFECHMLETGPYFGVRDAGQLVAAGGVHVHARGRRVAAIGNLATAPSHRRRGLAAALVRALCTELRRSADVIGLNVHHENHGARACYEALGFEWVMDYEEGRYA